jgi:hypothetical protein
MAADDAAVIVTLRANLKDYEAALKSAVRSTERAASAAEKAISNVGKGGGASNVIQANFQKSAGAIANDAKVLQFQLNDIFSGLAGGQGIRAVQQQLGQIAQQLSGGGLVAGARTMGTAMVGMINPINLAVVAFGLLSAVAFKYFESSKDKAAEATKEFEKQAKSIQDLADKYGVLFPELNQLARAAQDTADAAGKAAAAQTVLEAVYAKTSKTLQGMDTDFQVIAATLTSLGKPTEEIGALQDQVLKLSAAVKEHKGSSADALPVIANLNKIIEENDGLVKTLATSIRDQLVKSLGELDVAAVKAGQALNAALNVYIPGAGGTTGVLDLLLKSQAQLNNKDLGDHFKRVLSSAFAGGQSSIEGFKDEFAQRLAQMIEDGTEKGMKISIYSAARTLPRQAELYWAKVAEIQAKGADKATAMQQARKWVAFPTPEAPHVKGIAADLRFDSDATKQWAHQMAEQYGLVFRMSHEGWHIELADHKKVQAERAKTLEQAMSDIQSQTEARNRLNAINADSTLKTDERTAALQREAAAVEAAAVEERLLNEAKQENKTITPELAAQIHALAEAYADAGLKASQLGVEQQKTAADTAKHIEEMRALSQQISQLGASAVSGLVSDLRNGVDAGEAFNNMLGRILDSLIQMSIQSLFSPKGFGGIISSLLGVPVGTAHSGGIVGQTAFPQRKVNPMVFANAPRFASGGVVGLKPGEVPIIAHRGEIIVPNARRLASGAGSGGGVTNNIGRIGVSVNTGPDRIAATTQDGKRLGEEINKVVQMVIVKESRPGGLLRKVPS